MTHTGKTSRIVLRLLCAVLLVALGFAHRPAAAPAMPMDISAYTLPDGTVPTICIPDEGTGKTGKEIGQRCEACRISSAAAVPTPSCDSADVTHRVEQIAFVLTPEHFHRLNFPPNAPPRGPPVLPVSFVTA